MTPDFLQPKKGMTSIQAAELYLEEEQRRADAGRTFDFDELSRSGLARRMGFNFEVTIDYARKRFICVDVTTGYKTTAYYTEMDEKAVKRLVRALGRLKVEHERIVRENKLG